MLVKVLGCDSETDVGSDNDEETVREIGTGIGIDTSTDTGSNRCVMASITRSNDDTSCPSPFSCPSPVRLSICSSVPNNMSLITTTAVDLTGLFDWSVVDLTGLFDWSAVDLSGLFDWSAVDLSGLFDWALSSSSTNVENTQSTTSGNRTLL